MIKIDKILRDKKGNGIIYILIAMGILLMTLGGGLKGNSTTAGAEKNLSRSKEAELILSEIKGAGKVRVMISEEKKEQNSVFSSEDEKEKQECSVLIVADGGADSRIREKIVKAASAALGVEPHKIQVFERKE